MSRIFSSLEEIKAFEKSETRRRGNEACITLYGTDVIDCTEFLDEHPGGPQVISMHEGADDMKEDYDSAGHSEDALAKLKSLKIGELKLGGYKPASTESSSTSKSAAAVPAPPVIPAATNNTTAKRETAQGPNYTAIGAIVVVVAGIAAVLVKKFFFTK